jgi:hypothetical protein
MATGNEVPVGADNRGGLPDPDTPRLWVPEIVHTAADLLLRCQPKTGMIRRWRYN